MKKYLNYRKKLYPYLKIGMPSINLHSMKHCAGIWINQTAISIQLRNRQILFSHETKLYET